LVKPYSPVRKKKVTNFLTVDFQVGHFYLVGELGVIILGGGGGGGKGVRGKEGGREGGKEGGRKGGRERDGEKKGKEGGRKVGGRG